MPFNRPANGAVSDVSHVNQYADALTGVLADQPFTLANRLTLQKDVVHSSRTATEAELVVGLDASLAETVYVTLTANRVMGVPINAVVGQRLKVVFLQNGTGGWTVTFNALISVTGWLLNTVANGITELSLERDAAKWFVALYPSLRGSFGIYNVVTDYGADPLGVADSTTAIQNAINAASAALGGGQVFIPAGKFKITASIQLKSGADIVGTGMLATIIQPSAQTFAAFTNTSGLIFRLNIRDFYVDYSVATGSTVATNPLAAAFAFLGGANQLGDYSFANIFVQYAYYGFNDTALSYEGNYRNIYITNVNTGFLKGGSVGTTITLENMFVSFCIQAFNITNNQQLTMIGCAMQNTTGSSPFVLNTCLGLNILGFDFESCTLTGAGQFFTFSLCLGLVSGIKGFNNLMATGGALATVLNINSASRLQFTGCFLGGNETATGAGGTGTVLTSSGEVNLVTIVGGSWTVPTAGTGAPTVQVYSLGSAVGHTVLVIAATFTLSGFDAAGALMIINAGGTTWQGRLTTTASAAAAAGLRMPHGAAPTAPSDGDIWTTTAGMFVRVNGVTKTVTLT